MTFFTLAIRNKHIFILNKIEKLISDIMHSNNVCEFKDFYSITKNYK